MIFDTDVLIWLLKGNAKAGKLINSTSEKFISIITLMELLKGTLNKKEQMVIRKMLKNLDFGVLSVDEHISHRALIYIEEYGIRTGINVADALIAATAIENSMKLCTANYKDYREINDLELHIFKT